MAWHLVVTQQFGDYVRGQEITDPETVKEILESEHEDKVVKRAIPTDAAPKA